MKFITLILAFIVAFTVYAEDEVDIIYKKCQNELQNYSECLTKPKVNIFEQSCSSITSEKCQQFYDNPFKYVPICEKDIITDDLLHPIIMNYVNQGALLACQKDEAGNLCPFADYTLKEYSKIYNPMTDEDMKKAKENTCKSKICREATYKAYVDIQVARAYYDQKIALGHIREEEAALKEEIAKYLNSEECKAMSGDTKQESTKSNNTKQENTNSDNANQGNTSEEGKASSDASTLKAVTEVFISLGLLLLSFY